MFLDIRTVTFTSGAVIFALSVFCSLVFWTQKTYGGFRRWTVSNLCLAVGLWLLSARNILPAYLTILLSNVLVVGAQILILQGIYKFRGLCFGRVPSYIIHTVNLLSFAAFVYFTYWKEDVNARIFIQSTYSGALSLSIGRTLLRNIPTGQVRGSYLTGWIATLSGVVHFARVAAIYLCPLRHGIFSLSVVNSVFFLLVIFAAIGWTLGFILLNQERLIQDVKDAEARADRANAAKTEFVANIGHEIRTPLNGILGMTQLLLDTEINEMQRNYAGTVLESGEALLVIVNDLLDLSKMEAGKFVLDEAPFCLEEVVESAAECLAWKAQEKGLDLVGYVDPAIPRSLIGDAGRLRQILLNLGSNAIKFTREGSVALSVEVETQSGEQVKLRFRVSDTGAGIPESRRHALFERYNQLHDRNVHRVGGTGLGLAICKQLVNLMEGIIGVESEIGKGSEFWFTAVLRKGEPIASIVQSPSQIRCLSVITHNLRQRALSDLLEELGARHQTATTRSEVLRLIACGESSEEKIDLLILDTDGDGSRDEEILSSIRKYAINRELPVLLLTPLAYRPAKLLAQNEDIAFVTKPLRKASLLSAIARLAALEKSETPLLSLR